MVCKTRQNKAGFRQTSVKGIRPSMGCRVILTGKSEGEKTMAQILENYIIGTKYIFINNA